MAGGIKRTSFRGCPSGQNPESRDFRHRILVYQCGNETPDPECPLERCYCVIKISKPQFCAMIPAEIKRHCLTLNIANELR